MGAMIAPVVVSTIILLGFIGVSILAMKPELAGVKESVVLMLVGQWSALAGLAANYWLGTSNSSSKKDEQIAKKDDTISSMAATASNKP